MFKLYPTSRTDMTSCRLQCGKSVSTASFYIARGSFSANRFLWCLMHMFQVSYQHLLATLNISKCCLVRAAAVQVENQFDSWRLWNSIHPNLWARRNTTDKGWHNRLITNLVLIQIIILIFLLFVQCSWCKEYNSFWLSSCTDDTCLQDEYTQRLWFCCHCICSW